MRKRREDLGAAAHLPGKETYGTNFDLPVCLADRGLLMSRLARAIHLPAVTAYLVAGLLLGPFALGKLGLSDLGIGFGTLEQVEGYGIVTQVALGFIALSSATSSAWALKAWAVRPLRWACCRQWSPRRWWMWRWWRCTWPGRDLAVRCADSGRDRCGYGARCHPDGGQAV